MGISILVWVMMGIAFWHLAVLVPDRFLGGIIGALLAAVAGALLFGLLLSQPGVPDDNPPGVAEAIWASPGALAALAGSYLYGARRDRARGIVRD